MPLLAVFSLACSPALAAALGASPRPQPVATAVLGASPASWLRDFAWRLAAPDLSVPPAPSLAAALCGGAFAVLASPSSSLSLARPLDGRLARRFPPLCPLALGLGWCSAARPLATRRSRVACPRCCALPPAPHRRLSARACVCSAHTRAVPPSSPAHGRGGLCSSCAAPWLARSALLATLPVAPRVARAPACRAGFCGPNSVSRPGA